MLASISDTYTMFIHSFSQSVILFHRTQITNKTTRKINVLKVFHRTERPVALTTAHVDAQFAHKTKHKARK